MWQAMIPIAMQMMQGNPAGDAANAQARASKAATDAQERMFDKQVELQQPFRQTGLAANNRLAYLLGLDTTDYTPKVSTSYGDVRSQLLPKFTSRKKADLSKFGTGGVFADNPDDFQPTTIIDEEGLNRAIAQQMASSSTVPSTVDNTSDPAYGSLMRDFSMADFEADPGYDFRKKEGMKGIEGGAAARGGLLSGGALKAIQKYGQDLASQEYGNAYGRFNANQTNKYNRLAGVVNTGQGATNQITNAAGQLGQSTGANLIGAGNAQAAGIVGNANAWNSAVGQGLNTYQSNQLMDLIRKPKSSYVPGYGYGTSSGE